MTALCLNCQNRYRNDLCFKQALRLALHCLVETRFLKDIRMDRTTFEAACGFTKKSFLRTYVTLSGTNYYSANCPAT